MGESVVVAELKALADQLDAINMKLEAENTKMKAAILLLTNAVDDILPFVTADEAVIERARCANEAARRTVSI